MLQYVMDNANVTKGKAKELYTMAYTSARPINVPNCPRFKQLDKEAKEIQQQLMRVPQLHWMLPFCKEDNRPGSFVAHLFQWIECKPAHTDVRPCEVESRTMEEVSMPDPLGNPEVSARPEGHIARFVLLSKAAVHRSTRFARQQFAPAPAR